MVKRNKYQLANLGSGYLKTTTTKKNTITVFSGWFAQYEDPSWYDNTILFWLVNCRAQH